MNILVQFFLLQSHSLSSKFEIDAKLHQTVFSCIFCLFKTQHGVQIIVKSCKQNNMYAINLCKQ